MVPTDGNAPIVSVIMPTYNYGRFIHDAIVSVRNQTYQRLELIIIDNYSSDDTEEIVASHSREDSRIRYFKYRNHGSIARSRNQGISKATGTILAFLDSDDMWLPDKLDRQMGVLRCHPEVGMVYAQALCFDENGVLLKNHGKRGGVVGYGIPGVPVSHGYEQLLKRKLQTPIPTVLVNRRFVSEAGGFMEGLRYQCEDSILWARILQRTTVYFVNESLALYRVHKKSTSRNLNILQTLDAKLEYYTSINTDCRKPDGLLSMEIQRMADILITKVDAPIHSRLCRSFHLLRYLYLRKAISFWPVAKRLFFTYPIALLQKRLKRFVHAISEATR